MDSPYQNEAADVQDVLAAAVFRYNPDVPPIQILLISIPDIPVTFGETLDATATIPTVPGPK